MGTKYRIGDLSAVVLNLFGALPFSVEDNSQRNLGRLGKTKTLVYVDSPSKLCGMTTLRKAQELRETFMGGWDKVIVLGWNFDTQIGQFIDSLGDKRLEILVIPPDLLDTLASKAKFKKVSAQVAVDPDGTVRTPVRFSSLQYLTVKKPEVRDDDKGTEIKVELDNYMVLSPDALPLDDEGKKVLQGVIAKDPLKFPGSPRFALRYCQIRSDCKTHVLPVPVAIFTQYFGCWYLSLANCSSPRSSCSRRSGATA